MKKFVAVPAIISLVLVLSFSVQATAPIVDDIPDVRILRPSGDAMDIFDLNDYVTDFDDADSTLNWTSDTTSGGFDSAPSITITDGVVDIAGSTNSDHGTATFTAEDGDSQTGSDDVVISYSDFWLTRPSLSDALVAYDDTNIEVQPVYVVRDATTVLQSGGSLTSETVDWTINMRGLLARSTHPRLTGPSNYGLTVSVAGDGTFTLTPSSSLTEALEIGFRASKSGTGTPPKDDWSGARVIAALDMLPRESNSGDILKEHCLENTGLTTVPTSDDAGTFMDASTDYGWSVYYHSGALGVPDYSKLLGTYAQADAMLDFVDISSVSGLPEGAVGGPLPWGTCWKMNMPVASGNIIYSAKYDYPEPGTTLCFEFWVATDISVDASKERPIFRGGFSTTNPTHELSEFECKEGMGSPLPLAGQGWKKFQVYYTAQIYNTPTPVDHFRIILFAVRRPKTSTADVNLYIDNLAVYKVKPPIDVADLRGDPITMADDLAYGSTAIGMGSYPSTDDLDGTFERVTSKAGNSDPVRICGIGDLTTTLNPDKYNVLTGSDYTLEISSTWNYTFSNTAGKSLKAAISDFNYTQGSKLSVVSLTTYDPCNLVDQGLMGYGYAGLTFWLRCDATTYYQSTGAGPYGHIPTLRYGIYDGGSFTPVERTGIVFSKQTNASAMPIAADGWKKMSVIMPINTEVQGLMLAYYMICGNLQGSADPIYIDDITFHKVNDPVNYYDDSLFN